MQEHVWKFFRAGGFDQVKLETGDDLANLDQLDQKLWVALACPTQGLEFDAKTLALIDTDKDGRIRAPEILAATKWAVASLKNPDDLFAGSESLPLAAIADPQLLASVKQILANLGKPATDAISVADTTDTTKILATTNFNGDGIVPADAASEGATKAVISDIIACLGAETDRSGKPGVNQAKLDQFFTEAAAFADWSSKAVQPLGDATPAAAAAVRTVKTKVDEYFTRCRFAAFDPRAFEMLYKQETDRLIAAGEIAGLPLARIEAGQPLPLAVGVNPAWADALAALAPFTGGKTALTEAEWVALVAKLAPYEIWSAAKTGAVVEKLGVARIREILAGKAKENIAALIARDKSLEHEFNAIAAVDRLVRYHRDLVKLLHNFVAFHDFYGRKNKAIFQAGTLYLDQRSCELCLGVEDPAKHAVMAALAGTYLAYCDCVRRSTGERRQIVAAFTGGDSDNMMVGRNGIFYDRQGRDWDATVTKLIDNPISIRQAFWAPYKKFLRMIEEQVAKRAAAADASAQSNLQTAAATTAGGVPPPPPPPPPPKKVDPGMLAAIGLVLTTLLAALGGIFAAFTKLPLWQMPVAIVGIMLAISIPSTIIAWLKLRKRNLGPILDANGWALNAKGKINVPFGATLTGVATLPTGARRDLVDPFAEKKTGRNRAILYGILLVALLAGLYFGSIEQLLPGVLPKSGWVQKFK